MRRVYRSDCPCPAIWAASVSKALPDRTEFLRCAEESEKLQINSLARREGFASHSPQVLKKGNSGKPGFPGIWGRHKEVIADMSRRKCAYCEGKINAVRSAHVEHFQPKSLFPSMAYEWANYFLGCAGCNGAKGDKWPTHGGYLRPDKGDPSSRFVFREDGTVEAAKAGDAADRMLVDFDLRRKWLADERKQNIEWMLQMLKEAIELGRNGHLQIAKRLARTLLKTIETPERAYSVALTQCFWRAWKSAFPGEGV